MPWCRLASGRELRKLLRQMKLFDPPVDRVLRGLSRRRAYQIHRVNLTESQLRLFRVKGLSNHTLKRERTLH